jgi:predicted peptidase
MLFMVFAAWAEEVGDGPRTGFFRKKLTPLELLGEDGAKSLAGIFEPDEKLSWQLYVPRSYDASRPAGVIVFINRWGNSGGSRKSYNDLLEEKNLIWAGVLNAGDASPMNERMMRAVLAPVLLSKEYALDPARVYIGGFSGGSHVATILASGKPEMFKGGLFIGGTVAWDEGKEPTGLELMRRNRYAFLAGSNDVALTKMQRTADIYRNAGITNTTVITMHNQRQEMPGPYYLREAIEYLDGQEDAEPDE